MKRIITPIRTMVLPPRNQASTDWPIELVTLVERSSTSAVLR